MTEATGYEAKTIHRLLEVSGQMSDDTSLRSSGVHFERNRDNPLEADAIIIDEMSMVDIHLFYALLKALVPGVHLILVGDSSQLPSVGPGQVLHDLIDSGKFPTIYLKKIFRQAEESDIVMNAHRIHDGEKPVLDNKSKDFFFLERSEAGVIYKHMVQLIRDKLPSYVDAGPYDIQVLTPMKKGPLGAQQLNLILQEHLNPPAPDKKEHTYGDCTFREGDKVMQIKNDYDVVWKRGAERGSGVFNGDIGRITDIDTRAETLTIDFDGRMAEYDFSQLEELELAYAVTVHKSQGSEYRMVVIPMYEAASPLMNRKLLYTAITRAREMAVIVGSRAALAKMVANGYVDRRYTALGAMLEAAGRL
jgi:exodeoxyribonuclease V alpha subunit